MPTLKIAEESPLHRKLCSMIESRIRMAQSEQTDQHEVWQKAEERTLAYVPANEADSRRKAARNRGEVKYTTIQIPYSYALLMSAHTYWTSVFFGRDPVHQFSGRHGEAENQVLAIEALIAYQTDVGGMMAPYYIWLYDAGKYGVGIIGEYWDEQKIAYGQLVEMVDPLDNVKKLYQTTVEIPGYQGNKIYNVNPFDFWHDPRVPQKRFQDGEFCVVLKRLMWHDVLVRQAQGYFMNVDKLKRHATSKAPDNSSGVLKRPNWSSASINSDYVDPNMTENESESLRHPSAAFVYEFYVHLVPKDWGVGPETFPQKWCFTITEDFGLILGASPLGLIHGKFPFAVIESEVEGYATYGRGVPQIMESMQLTMDWLVNSHFYNVRAALNNQFIVDPSKLVLKDVEQGEPGFIWRLRPEAFGTDINTIFKQVQVTDVTKGNMQDLQSMFGMGERALGVNDQIMGVLNTGGRKTATEVRTAAGFGVNRMKTNTEYMSAMGISDHAQRLVQNSQQLYNQQLKLKIVGDQAMAAGLGFFNVTPKDIAGFFNFVPINGTLPVDRMAQVNLWKDIMQNIRMMPPQVAMEFDWTRIFSWVAQLGGIKNINQFKVQVLPDAQLQQQAQQGNVIPMPGRTQMGPGANSATVSGNNALAPPQPAA